MQALPMDDIETDYALAQRAAAGDLEARAQVTKLVDPLIQEKATFLCKRHCRDNRFRAVCTLDRSWGQNTAGAPLCEWGNASYSQFFGELMKSEVLQRYAARNGCSLRDFLSATLNSVGVYERWKDMRFERRIHVPKCVESLGPDARRVFFWMCDHDTIENMAQRLNKTPRELQMIVQSIFDVLIATGRSYTLQRRQMISLISGESDEDDGESGGGNAQVFLRAADEDYEGTELKQRVLAALEQLDDVSRFVLKAKFWEDLPMQDILDILKSEGISIRQGVAPHLTTLNQLFYFYYDALARLKEHARL